MKKFFLMAAVALCMGAAVSSCGSDDPLPPVNNGDNTPGGLTKLPGKVVTSIVSEKGLENYWNYTNDALVMFRDAEDIFELSGDSYVCHSTDQENCTITISDIKRNAYGFITSYTYTYVKPDYSYRSVTELTYMGKNLVNKTTNAQRQYDDELPTNESEYRTFTWNNGNITKIAYQYLEVQGADSYSSKGWYGITYSNLTNAHKQYSLDLSQDIGLEYFVLTGYMGDGPANLPSTCVLRVGENDMQVNDWKYKFELNSDGSIGSETVTYYTGDSSTYSYKY